MYWYQAVVFFKDEQDEKIKAIKTPVMLQAVSLTDAETILTDEYGEELDFRVISCKEFKGRVMTKNEED